MFVKKTIREMEVDGKAVLLRADYNVPIGEDGAITDDYRIKQSIETLRYLLDRNCRVVVCSHLGRPKSEDDASCSLAPVAQRLSELLDMEVPLLADCVGSEVRDTCHEMGAGQLLLLQNLRYHPEEEANDENFARQLAEDSGAELFVQDGFGVVHRAHASTSAITHYLPSVSGLLLEREVDTITGVMQDPAHPLMAVVGGAKISDKIQILERFIDIADVVAVVGAMANTFLLAQGMQVGKSLVEPEAVPLALSIMDRAHQKAMSQQFSFILPKDVVVSRTTDNTSTTRIVDFAWHTIADIESYPSKPMESMYQIQTDEIITDIGPISAATMAGAVPLAKTVIWNGTAGIAEVKGLHAAADPYGHGTKLLVKAMIGEHREYKNKPFTVVGGGDTVDYVNSQGLAGEFNHVSTGGGASLELMSGRLLPGVEALIDKS